MGRLVIYVGAMGVAVVGLRYFHITTEKDFFMFLAIWCSGYMMSYVVNP